MVAVLLDVNRLCAEEGDFRAALCGAAFVPVGKEGGPNPEGSEAGGHNPDNLEGFEAGAASRLRRPGDVFDPAVPELRALLGGGDFPLPSSPLASSQCLFALRLLGMQASATHATATAMPRLLVMQRPMR